MELAGFNLFQPTDVFTLDISAKGGYTLPLPSRWIESHGFDQVIEHEAYPCPIGSHCRLLNIVNLRF